MDITIYEKNLRFYKFVRSAEIRCATQDAERECKMEEELRKLREDVAWQRDLAWQRDQELQALRARESKTAVEIKGLRALATRLGEQMSSEASSAKKDLDYQRRLFGLQCEELFDLRARVGRAATGCCAAMCGARGWRRDGCSSSHWRF